MISAVCERVRGETSGVYRNPGIQWRHRGQRQLAHLASPQTRSRAIERARAVTTVLQESLPEGEWKHIILEMPKDYEALLTGESTGPATPSG